MPPFPTPHIQLAMKAVGAVFSFALHPRYWCLSINPYPLLPELNNAFLARPVHPSIHHLHKSDFLETMHIFLLWSSPCLRIPK